MPASIGVNLRVTGHCSQGGRKYMEDLFSVAYQQTEDERDLEYAFFGIYDGHGGSEAAAFAKEHLMDSIVKQRQFWSDNDEDVLKAIRNGYMLTHMHMWKEIDKWPKTVTGLPSTAGTTASVAFIRAGKIYIGHVGDSAIVLGYQKDDCDEWGARPLTVDHKPESADELQRIHQAGGKVIAKAGVPRVVWNRPQAGHKGPMKQNTPVDEIPFLAVARSLGDLWSYNIYNDEFIVSPDPDVGVLTIDPAKFRCLIFGTDGLWNMVSPETAVALVQGTERHNEAAVVAGGAQPRDWLNPSKSLVDSALERWSGARLRADNTSVVTLMLDPPGPPRAAVLRSRRPNAPMCVKTNSQVIDNESTSGRHFSNSEQPVRTREEVPRKVNLAPTNAGKSVPESSGPAHVTLCVPRASPALPAARTPLPPCASLDTRFSTVNTGQRLLDQTHEQEKPQERQDEPEPMTNYGNPHVSHFIVRLLTKREVTNTLFNVYEEIANAGAETTIDEGAEDVEEEVGETSAAIVPVLDTLDRMSATLQLERPPEKEKAVCSTSVVTEDKIIENTSEPKETSGGKTRVESPAHKSIQINEVSSSSPVDSPPKAKARKTKGQTKPNFQAQNQNGRSLRSHDSGEPIRRPHTRNGNSTRASKVELKEETRVVPIIHSHAKTAATPERVVIINKAKGVPAPVIVKVQQVKGDIKNNMRKLSKNLEPKVSVEVPAPKESKQNELNTHTPVRVTRSKDTGAEVQKVIKDTITKVPTEKIQPILPSQSDACESPSPDENEDSQSIVIVHNGPSREDYTPRQPVRTYIANHRGRNSKISDNNHESSKENFIGHPAEDRGPPGAERRRSAKRRPAGEAFLDQEPKEKRRTRLDDKKQFPQSHTPQDEGYLLGHNVAQLTGREGQLSVPQMSTATVSPSSQSKHGRKSPKFRAVEDGITEVESSTAGSEDTHRLAREEMRSLKDESVAPRVMRSRNECASSLAVSTQKASTHKDCNENTEAVSDEAAKRVLRSSDNTQHRLGEHYEVKMQHLQSPRVALRSKIIQATGKDCIQKTPKGEEMCRVTRSAATPHATPAKRIVGSLNMAKRLNGRSAVQTLTPRNRLRKRLSK